MNTKDYEYIITAAGRVNIIGEHIDYCGGKVFPAALSLVNTVYARPNGTDKINIEFTTLPDKISIDLNKLDEYTDLKYANYHAGCASVWKKAGHAVCGCDILQDCKVPFGSGLSSSAAIEVSTIAAFAALTGEKIDRVEIALAAQRAEREYVGMNCGIMDQYASSCGKKNHAMLLDCKTLDCEYVPIELGKYSLVITNCNKPHSLVESKYNERRAETDAALEILAEKLGISCLAELKTADLDKCRPLLSGKLFDRVKHVAEECERVNKAAAAMKSGNIKELGALLNSSHASLAELYEVTGKELDALSKAAREHDACVGSRMTGGGFGGCTVSLVLTEAIADFKSHVAVEYERATGYKPTFYECEIGDGLTVRKA